MQPSRVLERSDTVRTETGLLKSLMKLTDETVKAVEDDLTPENMKAFLRALKIETEYRDRENREDSLRRLQIEDSHRTKEPWTP